ncbi:type VI secretion system Vgr family protein [Elizabethkingia miricola]|uniref:type VI secretion system Vgr family protein n=1 Tax=Elizabethkingia miricola TaxID=172045 RepID=UPI002ACD4288|nr:contractile injection system protein, VgrG/Pvc8 family [Elizabethkingia miricola]WQM39425.1 contractile injection system protein, VgrG/Pvc8 family [Elizabethkingia miricola]
MKENNKSAFSYAMSDARINHPDDIAAYLSKKTFKDFLQEKDSPLVYCTLSIDGEDFLTKSSYIVELSQHTNDHDCFTIITPDDSLDSFEGYVMENSKKLLGKKISINFFRFGEIKQTFSGIVSNIKNKRNEGGGYGDLYIIGYAPSILMENGRGCQSFENKTLGQIINQVITEYSQEIKVRVSNPNTKYEMPYTVQYKESDYQFIKRLAQRYGEYFYYDGEQLIFGNLVQPTVKLAENVDLIDVEFEMMIKPQEFNYITYDNILAEIKEKGSDSVMGQYIENPFQAIAINASKEVYKKKPDMLFNATSPQRLDRDLEEIVKRQKEKRQHLFQMKGRSRDPELRIGSLVEITDINNKAMETYRIIDISHFHNGNEYYNTFVGIPDIFISPFFDEDAFPKCEEQSAFVMDNDHPQGMIRVQFPWQKKKGEKTPWLRIITPYAGEGKGMHIIPEIGEEVIVSFDNKNGERPFVLGAMFNGQAMSGYGGVGNNIKALTGRSSSTIAINDVDGSITLTDASRSTIKMDGKGNIDIKARDNLSLHAGSNIKVDAGFNIVVTSGVDILATAGTLVALTAGAEMAFTTNDMTHNVKSAMKTNVQERLEIKAENITIEAKNETAINGKSSINMQGGRIKMGNNSSSKIDDKGKATPKKKEELEKEAYSKSKDVYDRSKDIFDRSKALVKDAIQDSKATKDLQDKINKQQAIENKAKESNENDTPPLHN